MKSRSALFAVLLLVAGCTGTRYAPYQAQPEGQTLFERLVEYELAESALNDDPPQCATVLPVSEATMASPEAMIVEAAMARHLGQKLPRVIGPKERDDRADALAVDLSAADGRRVFAQQTRCPYMVSITPDGGESLYLVFWAQERLGLEAVLFAAAETDAPPVWRARHVARRSDGGLPLLPFGAAVSAFSAGHLAADEEVMDSLADDWARRTVASLPDLR